MKAYYHSEWFQLRMDMIAKGKAKPHILGHAHEDTTFLKFCTQDFMGGFRNAGCEVHYDEGTVKNQSIYRILAMIENLKPDMLFMVSHGRATYDWLPKELPILTYMQDTCGPLLVRPDLKDLIQPHDTYMCNMGVFRDYIIDKGIPRSQTARVPVPASPETFYPYTSETAVTDDSGRFSADIGFVRHSPEAGTPKAIHDAWCRDFFQKSPDGDILVRAFTMLFEDVTTGKYDESSEMAFRENLYKYLPNSQEIPPHMVDEINQLLRMWYITVYSQYWRTRFLYALDEAGMTLALWGNFWSKHPDFKIMDRGPVDRQTEAVHCFNQCKINLSINQETSMHQRPVECLLSGGFCLVATPKTDHDPIKNYYEIGKEIDVFSTTDECVDKCRYYLEHEDERVAIAKAGREKTLKYHTVNLAAKTFLEKSRKVLRESRGKLP